MGAALLLGVSGVFAQGTGPYPAHVGVPAADLWMYPNASTPGTRPSASTFSSGDDRLAQFVLKFDTVAAGIPAGLGADNYEVHNLAVTAVYNGDGPLVYDATEDPRASIGTAATIADPDPGRPLELYGTGFRGTATAANFSDSSSYGNRDAFASSFDTAGVARDVTDNVSLGYDSYPWAIGKAANVVNIDVVPHVYVAVTPGQTMSRYALITFQVNMAIPGVANYVRQGFNQGFIWFTISSMHPTTQQAMGGYPAFFTKENSEQTDYGDVAGTLKASYSLPLRISTITRNATANTASVTWNGSPGFTYVVQKSDTLAAGSWTPVGGTFTTAVPAPITWSGSSLSSRSFFRVLRNQP